MKSGREFLKKDLCGVRDRALQRSNEIQGRLEGEILDNLF
jgi:hypothetical protein